MRNSAPQEPAQTRRHRLQFAAALEKEISRAVICRRQKRRSRQASSPASISAYDKAVKSGGRQTPDRPTAKNSPPVALLGRTKQAPAAKK